MSHSRLGWNAVRFAAARDIPSHDSIGTFAGDPEPPTPDGEPVVAPTGSGDGSTTPAYGPRMFRMAEARQLAGYVIVGAAVLYFVNKMYKMGMARGGSASAAAQARTRSFF